MDTPFAKLLKLPPPHVLSSDNELKSKNQKGGCWGHGLKGIYYPWLYTLQIQSLSENVTKNAHREWWVKTHPETWVFTRET